MKNVLKSILIINVFLLSACSGGTIGGLIPAPKYFIGSVEGNYYYSMDRAFKVELPHPPSASKDDKYEWTYTKFNEFNDKQMVGIIFGPAAFDRNLYHAVLHRRPPKNHSSENAEKLFNWKMSQRTKDYKKVYFEEYIINDRVCFFAVYESAQVFTVLSVTDNKSSFYTVEADILKARNFTGSADTDYSRTAWPIFNRMLESFEVLDDRYNSKHEESKDES